MLHYKQLAVDLEKKIEKSKESKDYRGCDRTENGGEESFSIETTTSLKDLSQISFSEDCNKAVFNLLDDSVQTVEENEMTRQKAQNHMIDLISFEESSDERDSLLNLDEGILRTQSSEKSDANKENRQQYKKRDKTRSLSLSFGRKSSRKWVSERQRRPKTTDLVSFKSSALSNTLEAVLNKFHETQMQKFSELIEKQQMEHKNLLKQLETNQKSLIESLQKTLQNFNLGISNAKTPSEEREKKASTAAIERALTNVDVVSETNNGVFQHSNLDLDLSSFSRTLYVTTNSSMNVAGNEYSVISTTPSTDTVSPLTEIQKGMNGINSIPNQIDRKCEACTKIQAFVRGFLVRRLMRTIKVQEMIKTIKDSIKCLDELYIEDKTLLKEPDFLLADRIIKQIDVAVCEFNKIFFDLSISEKLEIIRSDREILKQKEFKRLSQRLVCNRPFSASTVSSSKSYRPNRI